MQPMRTLLSFGGRWSTVLGGVVVMAGSIMPWLDVPVLGITIPVSGVLSLGFVTLALGLLVSVLCYRGYRLRLLYVSISVGLLWFSAGQIERTKHDSRGAIMRVEREIAAIGHSLSQVGVPPVSVFNVNKPATDFVGVGLFVIPVGATAILVGCLLDLFSRRLSLKSLPLEFIGFLACRHCTSLLTGEMVNCPKCGKSISERKACRNCFQVLGAAHRYCFRCGAPIDPD
ncbi:MAG: hypothetical protein AUJ92_21655 [Armatimonadetes bacterium CG2_30_59_28]|nr:zinc ribbon domain-containing protein [Armatimonadota bacterium]OIO89338.1 MAG: hypothetical protein AUJ92_21655 [Armatimonadetes bacterium CG2_30_59_28]PIU66491.1 MAG: hypothetical protein COS85_04505 [Armatimonadetes bacterium CG07_land_8_20_14_0_80_59_28]PIX42271.1 MAG: hypothetical protein COZ56_09750 [Armatimonadetes bacterium CG_4_8_14_3_um_filter_58_9]PIY44034.1 MAG: hypothetical protein COZ05_09400 [Armatimonadetes bacterium CG_4_10_14_3_um_filter_59_10]PJB66321.1 MAG: hypothetical 